MEITTNYERICLLYMFNCKNPMVGILTGDQREKSMRDVKSVEEAVTAALDDPTYVQGGIKRKLLQQFDFPDGCNTTTSIIEVQAGTCADRHTHPGVETGYVL